MGKNTPAGALPRVFSEDLEDSHTDNIVRVSWSGNEFELKQKCRSACMSGTSGTAAVPDYRSASSPELGYPGHISVGFRLVGVWVEHSADATPVL
jgi:hypothetical protein